MYVPTPRRGPPAASTARGRAGGCPRTARGRSLAGPGHDLTVAEVARWLPGAPAPGAAWRTERELRASGCSPAAPRRRRGGAGARLPAGRRPGAPHGRAPGRRGGAARQGRPAPSRGASWSGTPAPPGYTGVLWVTSPARRPAPRWSGRIAARGYPPDGSGRCAWSCSAAGGGRRVGRSGAGAGPGRGSRRRCAARRAAPAPTRRPRSAPSAAPPCAPRRGSRGPWPRRGRPGAAAPGAAPGHRRRRCGAEHAGQADPLGVPRRRDPRGALPARGRVPGRLRPGHDGGPDRVRPGRAGSRPRRSTGGSSSPPGASSPPCARGRSRCCASSASARWSPRWRCASAGRPDGGGGDGRALPAGGACAPAGPAVVPEALAGAAQPSLLLVGLIAGGRVGRAARAPAHAARPGGGPVAVGAVAQRGRRAGRPAQGGRQAPGCRQGRAAHPRGVGHHPGQLQDSLGSRHAAPMSRPGGATRRHGPRRGKS